MTGTTRRSAVATPLARVQNVLAAGRGTLTHDGTTYVVGRPEVVSIDSFDRYFEKPDRAAHRLMKIDTCLHLDIAEPMTDDRIGMRPDPVQASAG